MHNIVNEVKNHRLYVQFSAIKQRLAAHQFVCWIAGGAVRDFLLAREVKEFDLVTDAGTEILKQLFPEAVLVGESFGVIKIPADGGGFFDLATFREEADYVDGRRPSKIGSATPTKDSIRRDFTVNAMFWDEEFGCVRDYRGGMADLEAGFLRCVGEPSVRFKEDYLRLFRLVRFAAQLEFKIDPEAEKEARQLVSLVAKVSGERIWSELLKLQATASLKAAFASDLFRTLMGQIIPGEMAEHFDVLVNDLFVILVKAYPGVDLAGSLKTRLKLSNRELRLYADTKYLLESAGQISPEELFIECEKSETLAKRLEDLVALGVLPENLLAVFDLIEREFASPLVLPQELLSMIPPQQIGAELREIRLGQLRKKYTTKEQVFEYLKKKYANFFSKT